MLIEEGKYFIPVVLKDHNVKPGDECFHCPRTNCKKKWEGRYGEEKEADCLLHAPMKIQNKYPFMKQRNFEINRIRKEMM